MKLARPASAPPPEKNIDVGVPETNQADLFDLPATSYSMPTSSNKSLAGSKKRSTPWPWIIGIAAALGVLLFLASVGVIFLSMMYKGPNITAAAPAKNTPALAANTPTSPPSYSSPKPTIKIDFPQLGQFRPFGNKGILWQRVDLPRLGIPPLKLNVFIPSGNHAEKSLPVVFEAPAGTPLLHGASIEQPQPDTEYLPFTEAGMITVSFDIDGPMPSNISPAAGAAFMRSLSNAYERFVAADAGVENGKMAIDFVLERLPMADPKKLIVWGHSSAATLALLLASKDSRIGKCIAMAPATDLNTRLGDVLEQEPAMEKVLPNLKKYLVSGSPITHVSLLKCPVFIAHAKNDDNVPFEDTKKYVDSLRKQGGKITFVEFETEGHYDPLLQAGIPKAIEWLK
jgi:predicted esterase